MSRVGDVKITQNGDELNIEWKIPDFVKLLSEVGAHYWSPIFAFESQAWWLGIHTDGDIYSSAGYIVGFIYRGSSGSPIQLAFSLAVKCLNETKDMERQCTNVFQGLDSCYIGQFISISELKERKSELLASGELTVLCSIQKLESKADTSEAEIVDLSLSAGDSSREEDKKEFKAFKSNVKTAECTHCKKIFGSQDISFHEKKCRVKCPECSKIVFYENWYDHKCRKSKAEGDSTDAGCSKRDNKRSLDADNISSVKKKCVGGANIYPNPEYSPVIHNENQMASAKVSEKFLHYFQTAMRSGDHSDVIVKVKGEEFRLHKIILSANNRYFRSVFKNDEMVKSTGIITIEDQVPETFFSFIHFVYTGKVDKLLPENVCDLYEIAVKYQENQLKNECLNFMLNTLSVDSFCDYYILALRQDEKKLCHKAKKFFINNWQKIVQDIKWKTFAKEYNVQASKLFLKAVNHSNK